VVILDDVHRRLENPDTLRLLADATDSLNGTIVVIAPYVDLPAELERRSAILEMPLPSLEELGQVFNRACVDVGVLRAEEDALRYVRAAQGLSEDEAYRAFKKAMIGWPEDSTKSFDSVMRDKRLALRRSKVLEHVQVPVDLDEVGGLDRLKDWLQSRKQAFSEKARSYGLPAPRGLLLMGVQGCGKSLSAKAVAGHWSLPLVRLDISAVFGSDKPESALRNALKVAEAMAPLVLWMDEIEKGFDKGGDGPSARLLGGMVTWLQEKQQEVFVVATANRVANLPPELPRKGRFDEIFFVDLPNYHERLEILRLHVGKRGLKPDAADLVGLAKKTRMLTGSELEQLIISAMYLSFSQGRELTDADLQQALRDTVPLYDTFEEEIKALREWARKRARPASTDRRKADMFAKKS
jgi:SpoVK/Ycf46/Vps4 family AAA+-type ATPase